MLGSSPSAPQSSRDITARSGTVDQARLAVARALAAGDRARLYAPGGSNRLDRWTDLRTAEASGRPWAVPLRAGIIVLDVDGSRAAVGELAAAALEVGLPGPVPSRPGDPSRAHLILHVHPAAVGILMPVVEDVAAALDELEDQGRVETKRGPAGWLRPPGSPHRLGGRARLRWGLLPALAGYLRPQANDQLACRLLALLAHRLGVARPHEERLAVAAYEPGPSYERALDREPAARGLEPADPASSERVVWDVVAAGLGRGHDTERIVGDLLAAPAGAKARTRADGTPRRDPVRWATRDAERVAARLAGRPETPSREGVLAVDPPASTDARLRAAAAAVAAWDETRWGRRLDRVQATTRELLRRARRLHPPPGARAITVTASYRSLGHVTGSAATARRALKDLEDAELVELDRGDPATMRPTRATLALDHPLLTQGVDTPTARAPGGVQPPVSDALDTLDRHDAWRVVSPTSGRVTGSLRAARPLWRRLRHHGPAHPDQLAGRYGARRALHRRLGLLAAAGLARSRADGRWEATGGPVTPALDAAAARQGTAGAALSLALSDACEHARARAWTPADRGSPHDPALVPLPPPPDLKPGGWDHHRTTGRPPQAA